MWKKSNIKRGIKVHLKDFKFVAAIVIALKKVLNASKYLF